MIDKFTRIPLAALISTALALSGCAAPASRHALMPDIASLPPAPAASVSAPESAASSAAAMHGKPDSGTKANGSQPEAKTKAYLFPGTGQFVKQPSPAAIQQAANGEGTSLNLEGADIRQVAHVILGDVLKVNYVVDPRVQGSITLRTSSPVPKDALVATLDTALRMNGAALVHDPRDNLYKIVPLAVAIRGSVAPEVAGASTSLPAGFSIVVVPLKFMGAAEMAKILQPLTPDGGIIRVDPVRNLLILAGSQGELRHMLDTVDMFDVDWMAGMSVGIYKLANMDVKSAEPAVDKLFGPKADSPLAGLVRVIPLEQLNAFMVVTAQPAYLDKAKTWIHRIDQAGYGGTQLFVYPVKNGDAVQLAKVLSAIYSKGGAAQSSEASVAPGLSGTSLASSPSATAATTGTSTTSLFGGMGGTSSPTSTTAGLGSGLSLPTTQQTQATQGGIVSGGDQSVTLKSEGGVKIIADKDNNSLLILATSQEFEKIEAALRKLDTSPRQVLIQVTIAQITLNNSLQYGLEWFFSNNGGTVNGQLVTNLGTSGGSIPSTPTSLSNGFSIYKLGSAGDIRALFSALEQDSDLKILSTPQLMVTDNQTAQIQIGDQVPTLGNTQTTTTGIITSVNYISTGVQLTVTPRINAGGLVSMDISQAVSTPSTTTTSGINSPTVSQRSIVTHVAVQSGKTLVLGGLMQDQDGGGNTGLPYLSRVPVLGALFGAQSKTKVRNELVVLITPRVINNPEEASDITREYRERVHDLKEEIRSVAKSPESAASAPAMALDGQVGR
jgi:general secretion pathway protein D